MSTDERNGHLLDDVALSDMQNLKCSYTVNKVAIDISADENMAWSNKFVKFSNPKLASAYENLALTNPREKPLIDQERNDSNSSAILPNTFESTGSSINIQSIFTSSASSDSIPKTELCSCGLKRMSESTLPFPIGIPFCKGSKDCKKLKDISDQPTQTHLNRQTLNSNLLKRDKDALVSTDILEEAMQILLSLSLDISKSLDEIPKSIALPSVIEKYSKRTFKKTHHQDVSSSTQNSKTPFGDISTIISPCEEILQLLAALQCRCLEYREVALDIAESIVKDCLPNFSDDSICVMKGLIARYQGLREDFTNFKKLCFRTKGSRIGAESLPDLITDCLQTSYLRLLVEENETFLVRLKFGIYMVRVNARLMRDLKEASIRVHKLEEEVDYITRTTIGYRV